MENLLYLAAVCFIIIELILFRGLSTLHALYFLYSRNKNKPGLETIEEDIRKLVGKDIMWSIALVTLFFMYNIVVLFLELTSAVHITIIVFGLLESVIFLFIIALKMAHDFGQWMLKPWIPIKLRWRIE